MIHSRCHLVTDEVVVQIQEGLEETPVRTFAVPPIVHCKELIGKDRSAAPLPATYVGSIDAQREL